MQTCCHVNAALPARIAEELCADNVSNKIKRRQIMFIPIKYGYAPKEGTNMTLILLQVPHKTLDAKISHPSH